jgi:hypothetical protein
VRSEVQVFPGPLVQSPTETSVAAAAGPSVYGAVAQLGERGLCKPEVVGSIPISSTFVVEA